MNYQNKRICKKCFECKNLDEFISVKNKGVMYYRYVCKCCFNNYRIKYNKKYYDKNKETLLNNAILKRKEKKNIIKTDTKEENKKN